MGEGAAMNFGGTGSTKRTRASFNGVVRQGAREGSPPNRIGVSDACPVGMNSIARRCAF